MFDQTFFFLEEPNSFYEFKHEVNMDFKQRIFLGTLKTKKSLSYILSLLNPNP